MMFNLTPAALAVVPKPKVLRHRSLEVEIYKPTVEAPQTVQRTQVTASDPFAELLKKKTEWIKSATVENSSE